MLGDHWDQSGSDIPYHQPEVTRCPWEWPSLGCHSCATAGPGLGSISWWEESVVNSPVLPAQCPAASLATSLATGGREPPCTHSTAAQWLPVLARQLCPTAGPSTSHGTSGGVCRAELLCSLQYLLRQCKPPAPVNTPKPLPLEVTV